MPLAHKELRVLFHQSARGEADVAEELAARRANPASVAWDFPVGKDLAFVVITAHISRLLEEVWRMDKLIESEWNMLPAPARFHYAMMLLISEVQATNELEGICSTRKEVAEALAKARGQSAAPNAKHVEMVRQFLLFTPEMLDSEPASPRAYPRTPAELSALYHDVLGAEIAKEDAPDGTYFRAKEVVVTDGVKETYRAVTGEDEIISRIGVVLGSPARDDVPQLLAACAEHFMFEYVHPFNDGNGRIGRFLFALRIRELLGAPAALSISSRILASKSGYYNAFQVAEHPLNHGELTFFVQYMLESIICEAQIELLSTLRTKRRQLEELRVRSGEVRGVDKQYGPQVLEILGQSALFGPRSGMSLSDVASILERSPATVRGVLGELEDAGWVSRLSSRPLVFCLSEEGVSRLLPEA